MRAPPSTELAWRSIHEQTSPSNTFITHPLTSNPKHKHSDPTYIFKPALSHHRRHCQNTPQTLSQLFSHTPLTQPCYDNNKSRRMFLYLIKWRLLLNKRAIIFEPLVFKSLFTLSHWVSESFRLFFLKRAVMFVTKKKTACQTSLSLNTCKTVTWEMPKCVEFFV